MSPWMTGTMKQFQNRCLLESEIGESTTAAATRLREHSTKSIDLVSKQPIVPAAVGADCLAFVSEDNYICGCPDFDCQVKDWPHQFGWRSICPSGENSSDKAFGTCGSRAHQCVVLVDGRSRVVFFPKMLASLAAINSQETQRIMHEDSMNRTAAVSCGGRIGRSH